jgi:hypothetical protein
MTAVELDIFTKISTSNKKTVTLNQLQQMIGLEKHPAEVLVAALVALGLLNATKTNDEENNESTENLMDLINCIIDSSSI